MANFQRLRDALHADSGTLDYEVQGVPQEQGRPALRLRLAGVLQLTCQRCLGALEFPLRIEVSLLLAATQAEIDAEPLDPEGAERIVAGKEMPVHDLIEDELLLAIPIAPRHERCAARAAAGAGEKHSPFAGLRGLLGGTKH
ncbi:MAG: YceD family protein [Burkholderiales bacterium]